MKKIFSKYPFFLILLPLFIVIHFEREFHGLIKYQFIYDRLVILFLAPLLFFGIFYFMFRSITKASLMAAGTLFFFYFMGDIKNKLTLKFPDSFWSGYTFLISCIIAILILLFVLLKKSSSRFTRFYIFLNILLLLFVISEAVSLAANRVPVQHKMASVPDLSVTADSLGDPDIYYIVLDAYTSGKMLQSLMNYSNADMENYLREKGFYIASDSKSNYNYTAFSIASTLNLNYFENSSLTNKLTDRTYLQALRFVTKNEFISFLDKKNYLIYNHSLFDLETHPSSIRGIDLWNFRNLIDQYNLVLKMSREMGYHLPPSIQKIFHNYDYDINKPPLKKLHSSLVYDHTLKTVNQKTERPKFVFAHFLETHPPFYFDSLGNNFVSAPDDTIGYTHQIAFVNKRLKSIIDIILQNSGRPTAIILCGDHGVSFKTPPDINEALSNFYAIYFSNKDYSQLSGKTHNVNTFRILLNNFFSMELPLLDYRENFLR